MTRLKWLAVALLLCMTIAGCSQRNESLHISNPIVEKPVINEVGQVTERSASTNTQLPKTIVSLSQEEELKWMEFCSPFVRYYPDFNAAEPMDERTIDCKNVSLCVPYLERGRA